IILRTFSFIDEPSPTLIYTLSLHDALPISRWQALGLYSLRCLQDPSWQASLLVGGPFLTEADPAGHFHLSLPPGRYDVTAWHQRSEEHTSELQSLAYLVCRLLLEKKKAKSE